MEKKFQRPLIKMLVRMYTRSSLPEKYRSEIMDGNLCIRKNKEGISREYIEYQLNRSDKGRPDYIIVCLNNTEIVGFIIAFAHDEGAGKKRKNNWTLDMICREPGSQYSNISQLMLKRLVREALKYNVKKIVLHPTTNKAAMAYTRLGFIKRKHDRKTMFLRL